MVPDGWSGESQNVGISNSPVKAFTNGGWVYSSVRGSEGYTLVLGAQPGLLLEWSDIWPRRELASPKERCASIESLNVLPHIGLPSSVCPLCASVSGGERIWHDAPECRWSWPLILAVNASYQLPDQPLVAYGLSGSRVVCIAGDAPLAALVHIRRHEQMSRWRRRANPELVAGAHDCSLFVDVYARHIAVGERREPQRTGLDRRQVLLFILNPAVAVYVDEVV